MKIFILAISLVDFWKNFSKIKNIIIDAKTSNINTFFFFFLQCKNMYVNKAETEKNKTIFRMMVVLLMDRYKEKLPTWMEIVTRSKNVKY